MGWLITIAVLVFLALIPVGASFWYDEAGFRAAAKIGPVRVFRFPSEKKKAKKEKPEEPKKQVKEQKPAEPAKEQQKTPKGGSAADFLPLVDTALDFLGDLKDRIKVKKLDLKVVMAGGDPSTLGIQYGKAWAALGNIMPHVDRLFDIKKRDVQVECDFTGTQTTAYVHADLALSIGRIVSLGVRYGVRVLFQYLKITNNRKGGASK